MIHSVSMYPPQGPHGPNQPLFDPNRQVAPLWVPPPQRPPPPPENKWPKYAAIGGGVVVFVVVALVADRNKSVPVAVFSDAGVVVMPDAAPRAEVDSGSRVPTWLAQLTAEKARSLARQQILNYRIGRVIDGDYGATIRYESPTFPDLILTVGYANHPTSRQSPPNTTPITIRGHQGTRAETGGMSIIAWRSGSWGFIVTTNSDQGPGQLHIVDALADSIASYADQNLNIRWTRPQP